MGLQLVTAASAGAVTLAQAKAQIGIESTDWDTQLAGYIAAATALAQDFTGRAIGSQTWLLGLPGFADSIELPRGPVTGVSWVKYVDMARATQTLASSVYIADLISDPQRLVRDPDQTWPQTARVPNAVTVQFVTGYATAPAAIQQAVLLAVASWFADREAGALPEPALALLRPLRRVKI